MFTHQTGVTGSGIITGMAHRTDGDGMQAGAGTTGTVQATDLVGDGITGMVRLTVITDGTIIMATAGTIITTTTTMLTMVEPEVSEVS
jgi:hypothetical protein